MIIEDILFSLERVAPYFLIIMLGAALSRFNIVPREFFNYSNAFTFKIALPFHLFCTLLNAQRPGAGEARFLAYALLITCISFVLIWLVTELLYKDKTVVGTLVQGAFRSNYILLGVPLASSVLGEHAAQTAAIATIVLVPAYNILSIVALAVRSKTPHRITVGAIWRDVSTNPLLLALCMAFPFIFLGLPLPSPILDPLKYVGQTGMPLGLLSIGGLLNLKDATVRLRPALYATLIKNALLPAATMLVAIPLGFTQEQLFAFFIMSASPVAISSYAMAAQMEGDAPLASNILILSTLLAGVSLAAGIFFLRAGGIV